MVQLPKMYRITQAFQRPTVKDRAAAARQELVRLGLDKKIAKGSKIGITVGSRGIQNLIPILRAAVDFVKGLGAEPFLLAAMGSHGGGTEKGQKEVLDSLGITENELGAKVLTCAVTDICNDTVFVVWNFVVVTEIGIDGTPSAAAGFAILGNHPNPFSSGSMIGFAVPEGKHHVELDVIDANGRIFSSLVNAELTAGLHQAQLVAQAGSSQVLFARLRSGSVTLVRPLLLLK